MSTRTVIGIARRLLIIGIVDGVIGDGIHTGCCQIEFTGIDATDGRRPTIDLVNNFADATIPVATRNSYGWLLIKP